MKETGKGGRGEMEREMVRGGKRGVERVKEIGKKGGRGRDGEREERKIKVWEMKKMRERDGEQQNKRDYREG